MAENTIELTWTGRPSATRLPEKRASARRAVALPARLTWKDQRGAARFASVSIRDVSECGVYVECRSVTSIPLYRLVHLQLERDVREDGEFPEPLKLGRVLSAVYRVSPPTSSGRLQGFALRLLVDPRRRAVTVEAARATA
jgi:hypothetical protein